MIPVRPVPLRHMIMTHPNAYLARLWIISYDQQRKFHSHLDALIIWAPYYGLTLFWSSWCIFTSETIISQRGIRWTFYEGRQFPFRIWWWVKKCWREFKLNFQVSKWKDKIMPYTKNESHCSRILTSIRFLNCLEVRFRLLMELIIR